MDMVAALLVVLSLLGLIVSFILLIPKSKRQAGKKLFIGSLLFLVAGFIGVAYTPNEAKNAQAIKLGFAGESDQSAALRAGGYGRSGLEAVESRACRRPRCRSQSLSIQSGMLEQEILR